MTHPPLVLDADQPEKTAVQTRDGRKAGIYAVLSEEEARRNDGYRIIGWRADHDGSRITDEWTAEGAWATYPVLGSDNDLINAPRTHTVWVNVYRCSYKTRQEADTNAFPGRLACVQVTITEGEGLS